METANLYSDEMMLHLVAAAKADGVDASDLDSLAGFLSKIKDLVTKDKPLLVKYMKKMSSKDTKAVAKKAMTAGESVSQRMERLLAESKG